MNSFGSRSVLRVGQARVRDPSSRRLGKTWLRHGHLPFSLRILLENLLRREDGKSVKADDVRALASWSGKSRAVAGNRFHARPRAAAGFHRRARGGRSGRHARRHEGAGRRSQADQSAAARRAGHRPLRAGGRVRHAAGLPLNAELEFSRNKERYAFLRWGQTAFQNFAVVPPDTGIVHQVNLEYLARVVFVGAGETGKPLAYPDTLVGTDSHTTMINGLGVLGWGVGGIEAEAAMLGQPVSMLIPQVVGFRLKTSCAKAPPPPTWCLPSPRCCARKASSESSSNSSAPDCQPAARRSRHHRQHGARVRRHLRHLPRRRRDADATCASAAAAKSRSAWSRPIARSRDCSTPPTHRRRNTPTCSTRPFDR